jgi:hypothetical protein
MNKRSPLFEQILKEATYSWEIDPLDRSWFITPKGELWGDVSHRFLLMNKCRDEWENHKRFGIEDSEIEEIFKNRLIKSGYIVIGELDSFYSIVDKLDNKIANALQGFAKSLLKVKNDANNKVFRITQKELNNEKIDCTMGEVANDYLMKLLET